MKPEVLLIDEPVAKIDRETDGLLETVIASLPALEGGKGRDPASAGSAAADV